MYSVERLAIPGHKARQVPNTFFKQDSASHLAVVFPGYSYRCSEPLLWYPTRVLLAQGADVLWVEYPYDQSQEFGNSDGQVQLEWLFEDSMAALQVAEKVGPFRRTTLVAKSLGTLAMGHVLRSISTEKEIRAVWMTPVLTDPDLRQTMEEMKHRSLVVIGSANHYYDRAFLEKLGKKVGTEILTIPGADHILETEGGTVQSIDVLKTVVESVSRFVGD